MEKALQNRLTSVTVKQMNRCTQKAVCYQPVTAVFKRGRKSEGNRKLPLFQFPRPNMWGDRDFNYPNQGTYDIKHVMEPAICWKEVGVTVPKTGRLP